MDMVVSRQPLPPRIDLRGSSHLNSQRAHEKKEKSNNATGKA